ncbi:hypothetical protein [Streptomyces sp. ISL-96]|uniref:hypothetical protein n=1 Tax=Streptomyces sp. ISL-96 TaxID=2819191 RepID=UPI002034ADCF|nr:hypothetical protein [Streptomyces sp. ISL-96]
MVVEDAAMGRWEGARELLAATGADWDRRIFRLQVLARAGARLTFADTWAQAEPRSPHALALFAHVQALRSMAGGRGRGRSEAMEVAWEACDAAADALPPDPAPYIVMLGSRPLEWCIDGHSVISCLRLCGEFGGQDGLVGF